MTPLCDITDADVLRVKRTCFGERVEQTADTLGTLAAFIDHDERERQSPSHEYLGATPVPWGSITAGPAPSDTCAVGPFACDGSCERVA